MPAIMVGLFGANQVVTVFGEAEILSCARQLVDQMASSSGGGWLSGICRAERFTP